MATSSKTSLASSGAERRQENRSYLSSNGEKAIDGSTEEQFHTPETIQQPAQPTLTALFRRSGKRDPNEIATEPSVFDDPEQAKYHQPHPKYENLHRFDPSFTWSWGQEKSLIRKLDWRVMGWAWLAFLALNLDNSCVPQANADNLLDDLGMNTNDYNLGNTLYRIAFLLAEIPSQLISKRVGPDRWIPTLQICWSIVATLQFFNSGRTSFLLCRTLIGLLQGGFIPDAILYLTYFYKGTELPLRMAILWTADRIKDVVAPLLAFGVLRLRGHLGYEGWRWLFLVEGLFNLIVAIASIFLMTPSPTQTKAWFRPNGWFTEHEEKILVNRILRDDPSKGDMHNRQAISARLIWKSLCDYDLWPIYAIGLTFFIPSGPPKQYLTLSLRALGFDTFETNLLSMPSQVATSITMLIATWISMKINQRAYVGLFTQLWFFPCVIALAIIPTTTNRWTMFALITVLLSYPTPHPLQAAWCSSNSNSVRTRAISASLYNMSGQLAAIISSNVYREDDKPEYRRGNRALIGLCCYNIFLYIFTKWYYVTKNKKRAKIWDAMTDEEKVRYLETTTDRGNKRLDFRFVS